ncbi:MAG: hypothetical protein WC628_09005 [Candidatus Omnitrophota bacterium]
MGIIYKLKPEVKEFILEQKKTKQSLSCRNMGILVKERFEIKLSKSSINAIFKTAGLSMPVGRRLRKRRQRIIFPQMPALEFKAESPTEKAAPEPLKEAPLVETVAEFSLDRHSEAEGRRISTLIRSFASLRMTENGISQQSLVQPETSIKLRASGLIFLQAAECLIGARQHIFSALKKHLSFKEDALEDLLYLSIEGPSEEKSLYLNELQQVKEIGADLLVLLQMRLLPMRGLKVSLADGTSFYLDGQLRTVWPTSNTPLSFSTTICNIESYINKYFRKNLPFNLFMAPDNEVLPLEFLNFLLSFEVNEKRIQQISLLGDNLEEIKVIPIMPAPRRFFIFGLWPWQYVQSRKVKKIGEFKPYEFKELNQLIYLADLELELSQTLAKQQLTLRGVALKTNPAEKVRLVILSNFFQQGVSSDELAGIYLRHWPNLGEAFEDSRRKIEFFNYSSGSRPFISSECIELLPKKESKFFDLLDFYLRYLNLFARESFFPAEYQKIEFPTMKSRFYCLPASIRQEKSSTFLKFVPLQDPVAAAALQYACRRVNEQEVTLPDGSQLYLRL